MLFRTYFDKDTTIIKDSTTNLGANPLGFLYYGGSYENPEYSRYIFHFPIEELQNLHGECNLGDLSEVEHKLVFKPTRFLGNININNDFCMATSYELCLFQLNQEFEEGCGNNFDCKCACDGYISPNCNSSHGAANWFYATSTELWETPGVFDTFSGDTEYLTCTTQACNDCLIEFDVTAQVNDLITGNTLNYGFGIAFNNVYEINPTGSKKYIGLYSKETDTFFKPYLETVYNHSISDDRSNFYLDKLNSLYLYVNTGGEPTNLDENPVVTIYDEYENPYITLTGDCVSKGVYEVNFIVYSSGVTTNACIAWQDVWSNIIINGVSRPNVEMEFELKSDLEFYNIGGNSGSPKKYGFKYRGIRRNEFIKRGDVRKIFVDIFEEFKPQRKIDVDNVFYRLYVKEGTEQLDIIPWSFMNKSSCDNYIYLDTSWLLPQTYYIDFKSVSNGEERTYGHEIMFVILDDDVVC